MLSIIIALIVLTVVIFLALVEVGLPLNLSQVSSRSPPEPLTAEAGVTVVGSVTEIQESVLHLCQSATNEILIESSGFSSSKLEKVLEQKLTAGVIVRILASPPEKQFRGVAEKKSRSSLLRRLEERGAEIRSVSNDFLCFFNHEPFAENHRKLCVVDGARGYLGNANFGSKKEGYDFGLFFEGKEAGNLRDIFFIDWRRAGGMIPLPSLSSPSQLEEQSFFSTKTIEFLGKTKGEFIRVLLSQIHRAQKSIVIAHHELSDWRVGTAIYEAKIRNPALQVKILLGPTFKPRDFLGRVWRLPNNVLVRDFDKRGIGVRVMTGEFHHAKVVVIDSEYIFLGSSDLNLRSLDGNPMARCARAVTLHEIYGYSSYEPKLFEGHKVVVLEVRSQELCSFENGKIIFN